MDSPSKPSTSRENTRRRKYTSWTIQKKLEALEMMDAGVPTGEIALEYRVNDTTVRRWAYERKKLKSHCDLSRAKRIRVSPVEEVNAALTTWYHAERRKNNAVTVTQLKVKAQQFFKTFGGTETFAASDGWLQNWKRKNGIRFLTPTKDQLTADTETVTEFKEEILQYIEAEELSLSQIFNVGETGLFYKMLPKKALTTGSRNIQDRLTVMMCCNADGSFQLPLLLIGKSKKPRALKNLATHLLPAKYTHETNTWMSAAIFESWFKGDFVPEVVNFLKSKNLPQKAILLLENVSSHPLISELKVGEIRAIFFPPNVTSLIQPLDQGIIEDMKNRYITNLLTYIINAQEDGLNYIEAMDSFSLKNAIELISDAWDQITHQRISNCWNKLLNVPIKEDNSDDVTSQHIHELYKQIKDQEQVTLEDINKWIQDDALSSLTDEEIIENVEQSNENETDTSDEDLPTENTISPARAMQSLECVTKFFEETGLISLADMNHLRRVRRRLLKIKNQI